MNKSKFFTLILSISLGCFSVLINAQNNKEQEELKMIIENLDSIDYSFFKKWSFHYRTAGSFSWYFEGENKYTCDFILDSDDKYLIGITKAKNFVKENKLNLNVNNITSWLWLDISTDKIIFTKANHLENKKDLIGVLYKNESTFSDLNNLIEKFLSYKNRLIKQGISDVYSLDENNKILIFKAFNNKYSLAKLNENVDKKLIKEELKNYKELKNNWYFIFN